MAVDREENCGAGQKSRRGVVPAEEEYCLSVYINGS